MLLHDAYFANGVNARVAGLQVFIHHHAAVAFQLRGLRQFDVRYRADRHYNGLAGNGAAAFEPHAFYFSCTGELFYFVREIDVDAPVFQFPVQQLGSQCIQLPVHQAGGTLYHGHPDVHFPQRGGQLNTQQAAAGDNDFSAGRVDVAEEGVSIHPAAHGENAGERRRVAQGGGAAIDRAFLLLFAGFLIAPLLYAFQMSLFRETLVGGARFVGLDNYIRAIHDKNFWDGVGLLFQFGFMQMPVMLGLALAFALILDSGLALARGFFRVAFFIPYAVPG